MGIGDDTREHRTTEEGLEFIGSDGSISASFPMDSTCCMTEELEILRGDPAKIIYDKTTTPSESTTEAEAECECEYIIGDYVVAMEENEEHVTVIFESEKKRNFDLIVVCILLSSQYQSVVRPTTIWLDGITLPYHVICYSALIDSAPLQELLLHLCPLLSRTRDSHRTNRELEEYGRSIRQIIRASRNCKVKWITSDDESYSHDGIPFPTADHGE